MGGVFVLEARVDVADEIFHDISWVMGNGEGVQLTVVVVVADYNLLWLPILAHLAPEVLVESVKVVL